MKRPIDAHEIYPGLWQGSRPPEGEVLRRAGFSMVVLCAEEHQPPVSSFYAIDVLHAPNDDAQQLTREQKDRAVMAAYRVAQRVREGGRVLVTCWAGWNRSGLVTAITLHFLTGNSGEDCAKRVKNRRPRGLCNAAFVDLLRKLPRAMRTYSLTG